MANYQWVSVFCDCNTKNKKPLISDNFDFDHDGTKHYQKRCPSCKKMKNVTIKVKGKTKDKAATCTYQVT